MNNVECESCVKRKTMYCPNSFKCYATKDKPYWQNRIMLLEETQQLKEQRQELRSWLEAIKTMYENEYKDVNTAEHYNSVLSKLNELENKSAENGKSVQ